MASLLGYSEAFQKAHGRRAAQHEGMWDIAHSVGLERQKEEEEQEKRANAGGIFRMLGGLGGGILAAVLTGGMSLPLSAAITGLASGVGGTAARAISGAQNQVGIGKWDVAAGEKREGDYRSSLVSGGIGDAITSGLLAYSMPGILKTLGLDKISLATKFAQKNVPKNAYNLLSGMGM